MKKILLMTVVMLSQLSAANAYSQCLPGTRTCDFLTEAITLANEDCAKSLCGCSSINIDIVEGTDYGFIAANFYYGVLYSDGTKKCFPLGQGYSYGYGYNFGHICSDPTDPCCPPTPNCGKQDPCAGDLTCGEPVTLPAAGGPFPRCDTENPAVLGE